MTKREIIVGAAVLLLAAPAFASQCPMNMAAIDAALAKNPQLTEQQMTKVKELRARGEEQHEAGQHGASEETLAEAMKILNIKE
ncbi:MAG: hypothetical protein GEU92_19520 [Alphaproteobacteria bacterium]|nr:hypothetical protein [Alphaproteobacteria bacterium]